MTSIAGILKDGEIHPKIKLQAHRVFLLDYVDYYVSHIDGWSWCLWGIFAACLWHYSGQLYV